jgi:hypothetical protein
VRDDGSTHREGSLVAAAVRAEFALDGPVVGVLGDVAAQLAGAWESRHAFLAAGESPSARVLTGVGAEEVGERKVGGEPVLVQLFGGLMGVGGAVQPVALVVQGRGGLGVSRLGGARSDGRSGDGCRCGSGHRLAGEDGLEESGSEGEMGGGAVGVVLLERLQVGHGEPAERLRRRHGRGKGKGQRSSSSSSSSSIAWQVVGGLAAAGELVEGAQRVGAAACRDDGAVRGARGESPRRCVWRELRRGHGI